MLVLFYPRRDKKQLRTFKLNYMYIWYNYKMRLITLKLCEYFFISE